MNDTQYRAWDETSGTMVYFDLKDVQNNIFSVRELASRNNWGNPIMRNTWVKDHKKESYIYEWDIVKTVSGDDLYVVERDTLKAGFYLTHMSCYPKKINTYYNRWEHINGKNKVILGNIYQNKYLLLKK